MPGCQWNSLRDQNVALTHRDDRQIPRAIHDRSPARHISIPASRLTLERDRGTCGRRSTRRTITCVRDRSDCAHVSLNPSVTSGNTVPGPAATAVAVCQPSEQCPSAEYRSDLHPVISALQGASRPAHDSTIRVPYANYVGNAGFQLTYTRDDLLDGPARRQSPRSRRGDSCTIRDSKDTERDGRRGAGDGAGYEGVRRRRRPSQAIHQGRVAQGELGTRPPASAGMGKSLTPGPRFATVGLCEAGLAEDEPRRLDRGRGGAGAPAELRLFADARVHGARDDPEYDYDCSRPLGRR
jgi:hypothetical protein